MDITVSTVKRVKAKTLHVHAGPRYWEDSEVNGMEDTNGTLIPFRDGEYWEPVIDLETGKIIDWPEGMEADIHYKVCDDGDYTLHDENGDPITKHEYSVPRILCPGENGYGDYIIMHIEKDGTIREFEADFDDWEEIIDTH